MPQVAIGAVATTAIAGYGSALTGIALATFLAQTFAVNLAIGGVLYLTNEMLAESKAPTGKNFGQEAAARLVTGQSTIGAHRIVYGEVAVGGQLVFQRTSAFIETGFPAFSTGKLTQVIILAAHEIDSVREVQIDDEPIGQMDANGNVVTGRFANSVTVKFHLGAPDQVADPYLIGLFPGVWTAAHRLQGRAYLVLSFINRPNVWSGLPTVRAIIRGKKCYDPRVGQTRWTNNWALIIRDYLTQAWGLSVPDAEIDDVQLIPAANVCDEQVSMTQYSVTVTPVRMLPPTVPDVFRITNNNPIIQGVYSYSVTFVDAVGETTHSGLSLPVAALVPRFSYLDTPQIFKGQVGIVIPLGPPGTIARRVYRAVGSSNSGSIIPSLVEHFWQTINDNTTTNLLDSTGAAVFPQNGARAPTSNTTGVLAFRFPAADSHIETGDAILLSGTVPPPFSTGVTYYWIRKSQTDFGITDTLVKAYAGTEITPANSAGTMTVTQISQPRYTVNGTIFTGQTPQSILNEMRSAAAGVIEYVSGRWMIRPGAYSTPVRVLTVDDLAGGIEVRARPPRSDLFNQVRGTYAEPANSWQATDFPPVQNPTYVTEDGGLELIRNIDLPFTANSTRAQRIAKITLERARQGIRVTFPAKITALMATVADNFAVTLPQMGWSEKVFSVQGWTFNPEGTVNLDLQEESASSYSWNNGEAATIDASPDTTLQLISTVHEPVNLVATSGSGILTISTDGTIVSRILLTWNVNDDRYAVRYDLRWRRIDETAYNTTAIGDIAAVSTYITGVQDGSTYEIGLRAVNARGLTSTWTTVLHTVLGITVLPDDVTGLAEAEPFTGTTAKILWTLDTGVLDYRVEVWAGTPTALRRTVIRTSPDMIYTGDDALYDGGPWRDLTFKVRARNGFGFGVNQAVLVVSNPAPTAPAVVLSSQAQMVRVKIVSLPEVDVDGMRVWMATSPATLNTLPDGNLVYDGAELDKSIGGLIPGTTYYFRAALFDHFGRTGLNASTASGSTPTAVPVVGGIDVVATLPVPVPVEGTVVYLNADQKIYISTGTQWITGVDASNISGTIVGGQIAAGTIGANKIAVANLAAINANLGDITAGTLTFNGAGYVKGGQTAYNTGTGFFLGFDAGIPKFSIGNPATQSITWDGTTMTLVGKFVGPDNFKDYAPGSIIVAASVAAHVFSQNAGMQPMKIIQVNRAGTLAISWLHSLIGSNFSISQVWVNGVPYGPEHRRQFIYPFSALNNPVTYSETVTFPSQATIAIYGTSDTASGPGTVSNLYLRCAFATKEVNIQD